MFQICETSFEFRDTDFFSSLDSEYYVAYF